MMKLKININNYKKFQKKVYKNKIKLNKIKTFHFKIPIKIVKLKIELEVLEIILRTLFKIYKNKVI